MITGFFEPSRGPHPYVLGAVRVPLLTREQWVAIPFLIDTGAAQSCIHPLDSVRALGVSPARLTDTSGGPRVVPGGGVGGSASYFECPAQFGFVRTDGEIEVVTDVVWIGQLTTSNQALPSLLGWNVLQHFRMQLDAKAQIVTLERS